MKKLLISLVVISFNLHAIEPVDLEAPGGVWWRKRTRITIDKQLNLTKPLTLEADEIVIAAPVYTEGLAFDLQARKLIFEKDGRIETFFKPAAETVTTPPAHGSAAAAGTGESGPGANGAAGNAGFVGKDGEPSPGELVVFGGDLVGRPIVKGLGQNGGIGGAGGVGQKGGTGSQGKKANAVLIFGNGAAGKGGTGGDFGKGGNGGAGGKGGAQPAVSFLLARDWRKEETKDAIVAAPGKGGAGGQPGMPGDPGEGGPGGEGDEVSFLFFSESEPGGPDGDAGKVAPYKPAYKTEAEKLASTNGDGAKGADAEAKANLTTLSLADLEGARFKVTAAWFEFHWWRLYELIARTSLELITPKQEQDAISQLLQGDLDVANLEVVAEKWDKAFVAPIRRRLAVYEQTNPELYARMKKILDTAEPYTRALLAGKKRGAINAEEVKTIQGSVAGVGKVREANITLAVESCSSYVTNVLENKNYASYVSRRTHYFEVPVCRSTEEFLGKDGVKRTIVLALEMMPDKMLDGIDGLKVDREVAPDLLKESGWIRARDFLANLLFPAAWAQDRNFEISLSPLKPSLLREDQIREFHPKKNQSTVAGSIGLHRGYVYLKRPTLEDLDRVLNDLVRTL